MKTMWPMITVALGGGGRSRGVDPEGWTQRTRRASPRPRHPEADQAALGTATFPWETSWGAPGPAGTLARGLCRRRGSKPGVRPCTAPLPNVLTGPGPPMEPPWRLGATRPAGSARVCVCGPGFPRAAPVPGLGGASLEGSRCPQAQEGPVERGPARPRVSAQEAGTGWSSSEEKLRAERTAVSPADRAVRRLRWTLEPCAHSHGAKQGACQGLRVGHLTRTSHRVHCVRVRRESPRSSRADHTHKGKSE